MRFRAMARPRGRRRRSAQMRAMGVRLYRQPPNPTKLPSGMRATASSSVVSFSPADFAFCSRRRRAATKSYSRAAIVTSRPRSRQELPARLVPIELLMGVRIQRMRPLRDLDVRVLTAEGGRKVALAGVVQDGHDR